jgi:hypothetical protein
MKWPLICTICICTCSWSQPIWHCSRSTGVVAHVENDAKEGQFSIASFNSAVEVIGVSINDLIDVYSGLQIRIGGLPLSACFMPSNEPLTSSALTSLGLQPSAIQSLARKSSIVQSNLYLVTNDQQMLSCIEQHFPAVGYLASPTDAHNVSPCF